MEEVTKSSLRKRMLSERTAYNREQKNTATWKLINNLRKIIMQDDEIGIIAMYKAIKGEADILSPEIQDLQKLGAVILLPRVIAKNSPLVFNAYNPKNKFSYDLLELECAGGDVTIPHIICIPCVAFNRNGYRLGYGGGYYDRTIKELKKERDIITIGIAYSFQEAWALPVEEHDEKLNYIITEKEIITC